VQSPWLSSLVNCVTMCDYVTMLVTTSKGSSQMGIRFKNVWWFVLLFHLALGVTLFTIGNQYSCVGPTLIIYTIIFAFSFFTIRNLKADPIQVSEKFLGNYAYVVLVPFLFYVVFSLLRSVDSSAILTLLAISTGYINIAVLVFICPLSAGPAVYQLINGQYQ
jgi:hypothetical protein